MCVVAPDPLLRAGAAAQLDVPGVALVDEGALIDGTVVVLVADTFDGDAERRLDGLRRKARVAAVLVTAALDDAALVRALAAGVRAIVWRRDATRDALRRAVAAVAAGNGSLPPDLTGRLMTHVRRGQPLPHDGGTPLTERERDVLHLVAEGCDTQEIARRLAYSERTIKTILHDVTTRLQVRNRSHAVAVLIRRGLL